MSGTSSIQQQIADTANSLGVDPALALAIANQESGFNQAARGKAGEIGVFQLMPGTAQALGVNPYDLSQNIVGGISYLKQNLQTFGGSVPQAVAAYNAGPGAVEGGRIPASTQSYVSTILQALGMGTDGTSPSASVSAAASPPVPSPIVTTATLLPNVGGGTVVEASGIAIAVAALALLLLAA